MAALAAIGAVQVVTDVSGRDEHVHPAHDHHRPDEAAVGRDGRTAEADAAAKTPVNP